MHRRNRRQVTRVGSSRSNVTQKRLSSPTSESILHICSTQGSRVQRHSWYPHASQRARGVTMSSRPWVAPVGTPLQRKSFQSDSVRDVDSTGMQIMQPSRVQGSELGVVEDTTKSGGIISRQDLSQHPSWRMSQHGRRWVDVTTALYLDQQTMNGMSSRQSISNHSITLRPAQHSKLHRHSAAHVAANLAVTGTDLAIPQRQGRFSPLPSVAQLWQTARYTFSSSSTTTKKSRKAKVETVIDTPPTKRAKRTPTKQPSKRSNTPVTLQGDDTDVIPQTPQHSPPSVKEEDQQPTLSQKLYFTSITGPLKIGIDPRSTGLFAKMSSTDRTKRETLGYIVYIRNRLNAPDPTLDDQFEYDMFSYYQKQTKLQDIPESDTNPEKSPEGTDATPHVHTLDMQQIRRLMLQGSIHLMDLSPAQKKQYFQTLREENILSHTILDKVEAYHDMVVKGQHLHPVVVEEMAQRYGEIEHPITPNLENIQTVLDQTHLSNDEIEEIVSQAVTILRQSPDILSKLRFSSPNTKAAWDRLQEVGAVYLQQRKEKQAIAQHQALLHSHQIPPGSSSTLQLLLPSNDIFVPPGGREPIDSTIPSSITTPRSQVGSLFHNPSALMPRRFQAPQPRLPPAPLDLRLTPSYLPETIPEHQRREKLSYAMKTYNKILPSYIQNMNDLTTVNYDPQSETVGHHQQQPYRSSHSSNPDIASETSHTDEDTSHRPPQEQVDEHQQSIFIKNATEELTRTQKTVLPIPPVLLINSQELDRYVQYLQNLMLISREEIQPHANQTQGKQASALAKDHGKENAKKTTKTKRKSQSVVIDNSVWEYYRLLTEIQEYHDYYISQIGQFEYSKQLRMQTLTKQKKKATDEHVMAQIKLFEDQQQQEKAERDLFKHRVMQLEQQQQQQAQNAAVNVGTRQKPQYHVQELPDKEMDDSDSDDNDDDPRFVSSSHSRRTAHLSRANADDTDSDQTSSDLTNTIDSDSDIAHLARLYAREHPGDDNLSTQGQGQHKTPQSSPRDHRHRSVLHNNPQDHDNSDADDIDLDIDIDDDHDDDLHALPLDTINSRSIGLHRNHRGDDNKPSLGDDDDDDDDDELDDDTGLFFDDLHGDLDSAASAVLHRHHHPSTPGHLQKDPSLIFDDDAHTQHDDIVENILFQSDSELFADISTSEDIVELSDKGSLSAQLKSSPDAFRILIDRQRQQAEKTKTSASSGAFSDEDPNHDQYLSEPPFPRMFPRSGSDDDDSAFEDIFPSRRRMGAESDLEQVDADTGMLPRVDSLLLDQLHMENHQQLQQSREEKQKRRQERALARAAGRADAGQSIDLPHVDMKIQPAESPTVDVSKAPEKKRKGTPSPQKAKQDILERLLSKDDGAPTVETIDLLQKQSALSLQPSQNSVHGEGASSEGVHDGQSHSDLHQILFAGVDLPYLPEFTTPRRATKPRLRDVAVNEQNKKRAQRQQELEAKKHEKAQLMFMQKIERERNRIEKLEEKKRQEKERKRGEQPRGQAVDHHTSDKLDPITDHPKTPAKKPRQTKRPTKKQDAEDSDSSPSQPIQSSDQQGTEEGSNAIDGKTEGSKPTRKQTTGTGRAKTPRKTRTNPHSTPHAPFTTFTRRYSLTMPSSPHVIVTRKFSTASTKKPRKGSATSTKAGSRRSKSSSKLPKDVNDATDDADADDDNMDPQLEREHAAPNALYSLNLDEFHDDIDLVNLQKTLDSITMAHRKRKTSRHQPSHLPTEFDGSDLPFGQDGVDLLLQSEEYIHATRARQENLSNDIQSSLRLLQDLQKHGIPPSLESHPLSNRSTHPFHTKKPTDSIHQQSDTSDLSQFVDQHNDNALTEIYDMVNRPTLSELDSRAALELETTIVSLEPQEPSRAFRVPTKLVPLSSQPFPDLDEKGGSTHHHSPANPFLPSPSIETQMIVNPGEFIQHPQASRQIDVTKSTSLGTEMSHKPPISPIMQQQYQQSRILQLRRHIRMTADKTEMTSPAPPPSQTQTESPVVSEPHTHKKPESGAPDTTPDSLPSTKPLPVKSTSRATRTKRIKAAKELLQNGAPVSSRSKSNTKESAKAGSPRRRDILGDEFSANIATPLSIPIPPLINADVSQAFQKLRQDYDKVKHLQSGTLPIALYTVRTRANIHHTMMSTLQQECMRQITQRERLHLPFTAIPSPQEQKRGTELKNYMTRVASHVDKHMEITHQLHMLLTTELEPLERPILRAAAELHATEPKSSLKLKSSRQQPLGKLYKSKRQAVDALITKNKSQLVSLYQRRSQLLYTEAELIRELIQLPSSSVPVSTAIHTPQAVLQHISRLATTTLSKIAQIDANQSAILQCLMQLNLVSPEIIEHTITPIINYVAMITKNELLKETQRSQNLIFLTSKEHWNSQMTDVDLLPSSTLDNDDQSKTFHLYHPRYHQEITMDSTNDAIYEQTMMSEFLRSYTMTPTPTPKKKAGLKPSTSKAAGEDQVLQIATLSQTEKAITTFQKLALHHRPQTQTSSKSESLGVTTPPMLPSPLCSSKRRGGIPHYSISSHVLAFPTSLKAYRSTFNQRLTNSLGVDFSILSPEVTDYIAHCKSHLPSIEPVDANSLVIDDVIDKINALQRSASSIRSYLAIDSHQTQITQAVDAAQVSQHSTQRAEQAIHASTAVMQDQSVSTLHPNYTSLLNYSLIERLFHFPSRHHEDDHIHSGTSEAPSTDQERTPDATPLPRDSTKLLQMSDAQVMNLIVQHIGPASTLALAPTQATKPTQQSELADERKNPSDHDLFLFEPHITFFDALVPSTLHNLRRTSLPLQVHADDPMSMPSVTPSTLNRHGPMSTQLLHALMKLLTINPEYFPSSSHNGSQLNEHDSHRLSTVHQVVKTVLHSPLASHALFGFDVLSCLVKTHQMSAMPVVSSSQSQPTDATPPPLTSGSPQMESAQETASIQAALLKATRSNEYSAACSQAVSRHLLNAFHHITLTTHALYEATPAKSEASSTSTEFTMNMHKTLQNLNTYGHNLAPTSTQDSDTTPTPPHQRPFLHPNLLHEEYVMLLPLFLALNRMITASSLPLTVQSPLTSITRCASFPQAAALASQIDSPSKLQQYFTHTLQRLEHAEHMDCYRTQPLGSTAMEPGANPFDREYLHIDPDYHTIIDQEVCDQSYTMLTVDRVLQSFKQEDGSAERHHSPKSSLSPRNRDPVSPFTTTKRQLSTTPSSPHPPPAPTKKKQQAQHSATPNRGAVVTKGSSPTRDTAPHRASKQAQMAHDRPKTRIEPPLHSQQNKGGASQHQNHPRKPPSGGNHPRKTSPGRNQPLKDIHPPQEPTPPYTMDLSPNRFINSLLDDFHTNSITKSLERDENHISGGKSSHKIDHRLPSVKYPLNRSHLFNTIPFLSPTTLLSSVDTTASHVVNSPPSFKGHKLQQCLYSGNALPRPYLIRCHLLPAYRSSSTPGNAHILALDVGIGSDPSLDTESSKQHMTSPTHTYRSALQQVEQDMSKIAAHTFYMSCDYAALSLRSTLEGLKYYFNTSLIVDHNTIFNHYQAEKLWVQSLLKDISSVYHAGRPTPTTPSELQPGLHQLFSSHGPIADDVLASVLDNNKHGVLLLSYAASPVLRQSLGESNSAHRRDQSSRQRKDAESNQKDRTAIPQSISPSSSSSPSSPSSPYIQWFSQTVLDQVNTQPAQRSGTRGKGQDTQNRQRDSGASVGVLNQAYHQSQSEFWKSVTSSSKSTQNPLEMMYPHPQMTHIAAESTPILDRLDPLGTPSNTKRYPLDKEVQDQVIALANQCSADLEQAMALPSSSQPSKASSESMATPSEITSSPTTYAFPPMFTPHELHAIAASIYPRSSLPDPEHMTCFLFPFPHPDTLQFHNNSSHVEGIESESQRIANIDHVGQLLLQSLQRYALLEHSFRAMVPPTPSIDE